ncbi:hypothetical protein ABIB51_004485, partial [Arthrobacter sp. UYCu712]
VGHRRNIIKTVESLQTHVWRLSRI